MPVAAAVTAFTSAEAGAADFPQCEQFDREEIRQSIQVYRVPALVESTTDGFHLDDPGTLTDESSLAIREIVKRVTCSTIDQSGRASGDLQHVRVVILAGTDTRAAQRFWARLRIDTKESKELANMIVNLAASSTRGRVVAEQFRDEIQKTIVGSPDLARLSESDPGLQTKALAVANLVVPTATIFEGPALPEATALQTPQSKPAHPRDFTVIVIGPPEEQLRDPDQDAVGQTPSEAEQAANGSSQVRGSGGSDEDPRSGSEGTSPSAASEAKPTWPNSTGSLLLAGGINYLHVLDGDHLGPSLACLYSPRLFAKRRTIGAMFGVRGAALFSSQRYQLSSTLTSSSLPFLEGVALGLWQPVRAFEVRIALALGAVLPARAFSGYFEAGVAINLPSRFEVSVSGTGGLLADADIHDRWGGIVAIGREF